MLYFSLEKILELCFHVVCRRFYGKVVYVGGTLTHVVFDVGGWLIGRCSRQGTYRVIPGWEVNQVAYFGRSEGIFEENKCMVD